MTGKSQPPSLTPKSSLKTPKIWVFNELNRAIMPLMDLNKWSIKLNTKTYKNSNQTLAIKDHSKLIPIKSKTNKQVKEIRT